MGRTLSSLRNAALALSGAPARLRFHARRHRVRDTQRRVLLDVLRRAANSDYGRQYRFESIRSPGEYRRRVPLVEYEDIAERIRRISRGQQGVLTEEPVTMMEPTSGSTAATKYVPYTASLLAQFRRAVGAWFYDLYSHRPELLAGRAYFCVTPFNAPENSDEGGIRIGFQDDAEYFPAAPACLLRSQMVVPPAVAALRSNENHFYITLLFLTAARDLNLVSIWNPSYLTRLLQQFPRFVERLADDLAHGTLSLIAPEEDAVREDLASRLRPDPQRARELMAVASGMEGRGMTFQALWPRLSLVSAWGDGTAALSVDEMMGHFPEAEFQPKGLLATEGVVSIPLSAHSRGSALAFESHFFEFEAEDGELYLADQVEPGRLYGVILTTGGGLYRYRLGDRVRVTGRYGGIPLLRFEDRSSAVSDWYGEKLNRQHVNAVIGEILPPGIRKASLLLALERSPRPHYVLWMEAAQDAFPDPGELVSMMESKLRENHHYDLCRRAGQLSGLDCQRIPDGMLARAAARRSRQENSRLGTQKTDVLDRRADWGRFMHGRGTRP